MHTSGEHYSSWFRSTRCTALSSQGFLGNVAATSTFYPLQQGDKFVKDFSFLSTIGQLHSQNPSITPLMGWQKRMRSTACCRGLHPLDRLFTAHHVHLADAMVVGAATLAGTYSLEVRSLGDLLQQLCSKLREEILFSLWRKTLFNVIIGK